MHVAQREMPWSCKSSQNKKERRERKRGYFASSLDNFHWHLGYTKCFEWPTPNLKSSNHFSCSWKLEKITKIAKMILAKMISPVPVLHFSMEPFNDSSNSLIFIQPYTCKHGIRLDFMPIMEFCTEIFLNRWLAVLQFNIIVMMLYHIVP